MLNLNSKICDNNGCDNMHRITSKSQHLTQGNLQFDGTLNVATILRTPTDRMKERSSSWTMSAT